MRADDIYKTYGFYDPNWCIEVPDGEHKVLCPHPHPKQSPFKEVEVVDGLPFIDVASPVLVQLEPITKGSRPGFARGIRVPNLVGYSGKCPRCGKVYYDHSTR